jgi:hypothetical protein
MSTASSRNGKDDTSLAVSCLGFVFTTALILFALFCLNKLWSIDDRVRQLEENAKQNMQP